jgi:hypothetical protein
MRDHRMYRILFLVAAGASVSCVSIDGGAVEASWVVVDVDGHAIARCGCADPEIVSVRLQLVGKKDDGVLFDPCQERASCQFPCERRTGATPFDIPPGSYLMSLVAVDATGRDLDSLDTGDKRVVAPAPVLREVVRGQPTQLDALALVAGCAARCGQNKNTACDSP